MNPFCCANGVNEDKKLCFISFIFIIFDNSLRIFYFRNLEYPQYHFLFLKNSLTTYYFHLNCIFFQYAVDWQQIFDTPFSFMEVISTLWDSGVLGAMATMAVTTLGQLSALNNQKFTAVLETLQKQQSSDSAVHDSAFARSSDKGVVVRRIMLFMAFFVLAVCPFIFAFFGDIPIAVETVQQSGGWLWGLVPEKESFAVAYINGFYLADVWKELMANLISAYIGAGITRKAFTLGK